jgi:hypothetical protein
MKKITLLAVAAIMAVSCSDDDNSNTPASLGGTWKLTFIDLNQTPYDFNGDGTASENYLEEIDCPSVSKIVFGSGNTAVFPAYCLSEEPYSDESVTYEASGNDVTFTYFFTELQQLEKTTYHREGNTLTATFDFEGGYHPYIPGLGQFGDITTISRATFVYTKE